MPTASRSARIVATESEQHCTTGRAQLHARLSEIASEYLISYLSICTVSEARGGRYGRSQARSKPAKPQHGARRGRTAARVLAAPSVVLSYVLRDVTRYTVTDDEGSRSGPKHGRAVSSRQTPNARFGFLPGAGATRLATGHVPCSGLPTWRYPLAIQNGILNTYYDG